MKRLLAFVLIVFIIVGCATKQNYMLPSEKNKNDFLVDREDCTNLTGFRGDGTFLFGPIIIILPIFVILEVIRGQQQKKFQICMADRGYQCNENCWDIGNTKSNANAFVTQTPQNTVSAQKESGRTTTDIKQNIPTEVVNQSVVAKEIARSGNYVAYDNGVVLDTKTALMWPVKDNDSGISWEKAKVYCYEYRGGGYSDWRMPTHDEIATLYDNQTNGMNGYAITRLIELTQCCPWAANGDGAYFRFDGGTCEWTNRPFVFRAYRALPVRSNK